MKVLLAGIIANTSDVHMNFLQCILRLQVALASLGPDNPQYAISMCLHTSLTDAVRDFEEDASAGALVAIDVSLMPPPSWVLKALASEHPVVMAVHAMKGAPLNWNAVQNHLEDGVRDGQSLLSAGYRANCTYDPVTGAVDFSSSDEPSFGCVCVKRGGISETLQPAWVLLDEPRIPALIPYGFAGIPGLRLLKKENEEQYDKNETTPSPTKPIPKQIPPPAPEKRRL